MDDLDVELWDTSTATSVKKYIISFTFLYTDNGIYLDDFDVNTFELFVENIITNPLAQTDFYTTNIGGGEEHFKYNGTDKKFICKMMDGLCYEDDKVILVEDTNLFHESLSRLCSDLNKFKINPELETRGFFFG